MADDPKRGLTGARARTVIPCLRPPAFRHSTLGLTKLMYRERRQSFRDVIAQGDRITLREKKDEPYRLLDIATQFGPLTAH